jgi:hypothetical protein
MARVIICASKLVIGIGIEKKPDNGNNVAARPEIGAIDGRPCPHAVLVVKGFQNPCY